MGNATETAAAYLAGIIDGEGYIGIMRRIERRKSPWKDYESYNLTVIVVNNHRGLVETLRHRYGGQMRCRKSGTYYWKVTDRAAEGVLRDALPYLIVKREQALIALEFRGTFPSPHPKAGCSDDLISRRRAFKSRLSAINQRRGREVVAA